MTQRFQEEIESLEKFVNELPVGTLMHQSYDIEVLVFPSRSPDRLTLRDGDFAVLLGSRVAKSGTVWAICLTRFGLSEIDAVRLKVYFSVVEQP